MLTRILKAAAIAWDHEKKRQKTGAMDWGTGKARRKVEK